MFAFVKNGKVVYTELVVRKVVYTELVVRKVVYTELVVRKHTCCNSEQAATYVTWWQWLGKDVGGSGRDPT